MRFKSYWLCILIFSFNAYSSSGVVLECNNCNENAMHIVAQAYGYQQIKSGSQTVMIFSPESGMFREYKVSVATFDDLGTGNTAERLPLKSNHRAIETDLKTSYTTLTSMRARLSIRQDLTIGQDSPYRSAADAINPNFRDGAALAVRGLLNSFDEFEQDLLILENGLRQPNISYGLSTIFSLMVSRSRIQRSIVTIGFENDGSTWEVEVSLQLINGKTRFSVKPTDVAYFANGQRMPINALEAQAFAPLIETRLLGGIVDAGAFFNLLESMSGVQTGQSIIQVEAPANGNDGCFCTQSYVEWPDGTVTTSGECEPDPDC